MAKLSIGSITAIVNGYTVNNGLPYFQKAIPKALRHRIGKASIKIPLKPEGGHAAIQCHRLNQRYTALFKAMTENESLVPSEVKLAALALVEHHGLKPGDGTKPLKEPIELQGSFDPTPHVSAFVDSMEEMFDGRSNALTRAALQTLQGPLPVLLSEAFTVYLENHAKKARTQGSGMLNISIG